MAAMAQRVAERFARQASDSADDPKAFGKETARLVTEAAARFAYDLLYDSMESKQITHHEAVDERVLKREIAPKAEAYFVDAYEEWAKDHKAGKRNSWGRVNTTDWDGDFQREVLKPALVAAFKRGAKYRGFGPMSFFGKLRKIERIPYMSVMFKRSEAFEKQLKKPAQ